MIDKKTILRILSVIFVAVMVACFVPQTGALVFAAKAYKHSDVNFNINGDIELDETENQGQAYVSKRGTYDEDKGSFNFEITVEATGDVTNVNLKDVIIGNALIFNNDVQVSGNSSNYTMNGVSNVFDYTFDSMQEGEMIYITYSASVNFSMDYDKDGKISADQTRNMVTVQSEGGNLHRSECSCEVVFNTTKKANASFVRTTEGGDRIYEWTIMYNELGLASAAGYRINDTISKDSSDYMKYYGEGLKIKVFDRDGNTVDTRTVLYSALESFSDSYWSYEIPYSDTQPYKYEITYNTVVDMDKVEDSVVTVSNDANGAVSSVVVTPLNHASVAKRVESFSAEKVNWEITLGVPEEGLTQAFMTDTLPNTWINGEKIYDLLDGSPQITGLLDGESYTVDTDSQGQVKITFYQNAAKTITGLKEASSGHTITVKLTSKVNSDWLNAGYEDGSFEQKHINSVEFNGKEATADVVFEKPGIEKKGEVLKDSQGNITGLKYTVVLKGVSETPVSISDFFDTSILELDTSKEGEINHLRIWGGNQYTQDAGGLPVLYTDNSNGIILTADTVPMQMDGSYYPYYKIIYYLSIKEGVDLSALTTANGGVYELSNTVLWGDYESSFSYKNIIYGSIKLTNLVTVNGESTEGNLADGTYEFKIKGPGDNGEVSKTVTITVINGQTASATVDGQSADIDSDGYVEVEELIPGEYVITETAPTNGTSLVGQNDKKVTVEAGKSGSDVSKDARASFTNNINVRDIEVYKKWVNVDKSDTWPEGITVDIQLTADGKAVSGKTVTLSTDQPSYEFENLPRYQEDGTTEIVYSVEEVNVPNGYTSETGNIKEGQIIVTNTYTDKNNNNDNNTTNKAKIIVTVTKDGKTVSDMAEHLILKDGEKNEYKNLFMFDNGSYVYDPSRKDVQQLSNDSYDLCFEAPGYLAVSSSIKYGDNVDAIKNILDFYTISIKKDPAFENAISVLSIAGEGKTPESSGEVAALYKEKLDINTIVNDGYHFSGYSVLGTAPLWKPEQVNQTIEVQGKAEIIAHAEANLYTVHFAPNRAGCKGTMKDQDMVYDQPQTLFANQFKCNGYSFTGWNTKADGSGTTYKNGERVSNLTTKDGGDVVLYAQWTAMPVVIDNKQAKICLDAGLKGTSSKNKITAKWGKVKDADYYNVYATYSGNNSGYKKIKTVNGKINKLIIKKLAGKKLDSKRCVMYYVVAYKKVDGKVIKLAKSLTVYVVGSENKENSNIKAIKVTNESIKLKKGKTKNIKAKFVLYNKGKKPLDYGPKFRYATSNDKVAKVSKKGKIKAVGKGKCYIYVYAPNGCSKKIQVTVN